MTGPSDRMGPARAQEPGAAHGAAVLLVAALLAAGTAWPLGGAKAPVFPQPAPAQPGSRSAAGAGGRAGGAEGKGEVEARSAPAAPRAKAPLDINTADIQALEALPGIGPTLAARIVADREAHGPFRTAEELRRVAGIGPKRWERIRPLVRSEAP